VCHYLIGFVLASLVAIMLKLLPAIISGLRSQNCGEILILLQLPLFGTALGADAAGALGQRRRYLL